MALDGDSSIFDYIIVGGGSAGAVVAARLSEDARRRVLLVEAGRDYPPGTEPPAIRDTFHTAVFRAENMWPSLLVHWRRAVDAHGKPVAPRRYEQARIMGGGSSVNAMAAIRGLPEDYDEWVALGARGWAWRDCLEYFVKLERDQDFAGEGHGTAGPIPIRRNPRENWPPFARAAAAVLAEEGHPYINDLNMDFRDGLCSVPVTSLPTGRVSTAAGYLTAAVRARRNLEILSDTLVLAVLTEDAQARAVRLRGTNGDERDVRGREIVLAAGALHTPALLMRAGIGDAAMLRSFGIPVVANRPGTGQGLQDHPAVAIGLHLKRIAKQTGAWRPAPNVSLRFSSGLPEAGRADCWLSMANKTSWHPLGHRIAALGVSIYKPYSRGSLTLKSPSPLDEPLIEFNLLGDPRDVARMKLGLKKARSIAFHPSLAALVNKAFLASFSERVRDLNRYCRRSWMRSWAATMALDGPAPLREWLLDRVVAPNSDIDPVLDDDARLTQWLHSSATGFYHPVGTCRMGAPDDPLAVVDCNGAVYGVRGLRVVDASLMPSIVRANTNIPTIMIAEKIAAAIRSNH